MSRFRIGQVRVDQWLAVALSLIAAAALVTAFPQPAAAAAGCSWSGCDGLWPGEQGCRDDQKVVSEYVFYVGSNQNQVSTAKLYYSPACQAAWGEFIRVGDPLPYFDLQLWAQPQYGGTKYRPVNAEGFDSTLVAGTDNVYRTVLASWEYSLKACHSTYPFPNTDPEGDSSAGDCTRWT